MEEQVTDVQSEFWPESCGAQGRVTEDAPSSGIRRKIAAAAPWAALGTGVPARSVHGSEPLGGALVLGRSRQWQEQSLWAWKGSSATLFLAVDASGKARGHLTEEARVAAGVLMRLWQLSCVVGDNMRSGRPRAFDLRGPAATARAIATADGTVEFRCSAAVCHQNPCA